MQITSPHATPSPSFSERLLGANYDDYMDDEAAAYLEEEEFGPSGKSKGALGRGALGLAAGLGLGLIAPTGNRPGALIRRVKATKAMKDMGLKNYFQNEIRRQRLARFTGTYKGPKESPVESARRVVRNEFTTSQPAGIAKELKNQLSPSAFAKKIREKRFGDPMIWAPMGIGGISATKGFSENPAQTIGNAYIDHDTKQNMESSGIMDKIKKRKLRADRRRDLRDAISDGENPLPFSQL